MPGEFSDLENCSDLENLLALAEEEFSYETECTISEKKEERGDFEESEDCEIIAIKETEVVTESKTPPFSAIRSIISSSVSTTLKVQKSISEFFKAPKRLPEEVAVEMVVEKKTKTAPFVFPSKAPKSTGTTAEVKTTTTSKHKLPKFKLIPGTPFSVDAFSYGQIPGVTGYFLTHFHSDHYKGLCNKLFSERGLRLYCSEVTGNLVKKELKVRGDVITTLKIGNIYLIEGIHVGVLDANHCPGSVMFVFGVPEGNVIKWHLHCGDFRACPSILNQKLNYLDREEQLKFTDFLFDSVYLDTTYAHPKHCFPPQEQVIAACIDGCSRLIHGQYDPAGQKRLVPLKWMIAVGSYLIGKERIILAIAETFDLLIYADARKRSILRLLQWPELEDRLTDDPFATPLHFVSMGLLSKQKLSDYRDSFKGKFSHVLGIRPTGWTFNDQTDSSESSEWNLAMPKIDGNAGIWPVPYSEHSSYKELEVFLKTISVHRVIPTVDNYADIVLDSRRVGGNTGVLLSQWSRRK